jgi:3'-phosphoadenosine 5'-phosphosulfate sulfotransferase (PAPS reductase)/FAD synthetase
MTPVQIAGFRAHAMTAAFARKRNALTETLRRVDPATAYVSFSAGKDSSVVAHAACAVHPGIAVLMVDPGCPTHWSEAERTQWIDYAAASGWALKLFAWDKWAAPATGAADNVATYQARVHRSMFADLHAYAAQRGLSTRIMGMRADESANRRMSFRVRGSAYRYADGSAALLPIALWSAADVWAYVLTTGMPILDVYMRLGPGARNGLVGRSGEEFGRSETLKFFFPDVWRWGKAAGVYQ